MAQSYEDRLKEADETLKKPSTFPEWYREYKSELRASKVWAIGLPFFFLLAYIATQKS